MKQITLTCGSHAERSQGMCLAEYVAFLHGEEHYHKPKCIPEDLVLLVWAANDWHWYSDKDRTKALLPLVPLLAAASHGSLEVVRRRAALTLSYVALHDFGVLIDPPSDHEEYAALYVKLVAEGYCEQNARLAEALWQVRHNCQSAYTTLLYREGTSRTGAFAATLLKQLCEV